MVHVSVRIGSLDVEEAELARLSGIVDDAERERAARFRFARDRRRFIVRRGRLREWLGERVGSAPEQLRFSAGSHGKPALSDGGPCFSLSHSGERMMLAIADVEIGCDLERIDEKLEWQSIADRFFTRAECARLASAPAGEGRIGFFDCWARKEAFVKGLGLGLSYPLDAFEVSIGSDARVLAGGDGWSMLGRPWITGHASAIVAKADAMTVDLQTFTA